MYASPLRSHRIFLSLQVNRPDMKNKKMNEPRFMEIQGVAVRQIVMDQTEWVTLWGYRLGESEPQRTDYVMEFEILNKLLRLHADLGDEIQMIIVERLEEGVQGPQVLDIEAMFGMPAVLDRCRLKCFHPRRQVSQGKWEEDPRCIYIDDVVAAAPKSPNKQSLYRQNFYKCVQLLVKSYRLYLGYMELDFDEASAMEKAGLQDDVKFKMAYYAWKTSRGESLK
jgi:hypothetical protein